MNHLRLHTTEHEAENTTCTSCMIGYPTWCICGGLIHAQSVTSWDLNKWDDDEQHIVFMCSNCEKDYEEKTS